MSNYEILINTYMAVFIDVKIMVSENAEWLVIKIIINDMDIKKIEQMHLLAI